MFKKDYKKSLRGKRKTPTWKNLLKKSLFVFYFLRFYAKLSFRPNHSKSNL